MGKYWHNNHLMLSYNVIHQNLPWLSQCLHTTVNNVYVLVCTYVPSLPFWIYPNSFIWLSIATFIIRQFQISYTYVHIYNWR